DPPEVHPAHGHVAQLDAAEAGPGQVGRPEVGPAQVGPREAGPPQVSAGIVSPGRVSHVLTVAAIPDNRRPRRAGDAGARRPERPRWHWCARLSGAPGGKGWLSWQE